MGGLARRAVYVKQVRDQTPSALLVDAGGSLVGGSDAEATRTDEQLIRAMAEMRYDALNVGRSELKAEPHLLAQLADSGPVLISSGGGLAPTRSPGSSLVRPYLVREVNGARVGLVGVTAVSDSARNVSEALRPVVSEVRRQADIVVALTDLTPAEVDELALAGLDLQVILGARGTVARPATWVGQAIVAAPGADGRSVGRLVLRIDGRGQIVSYEDGQQFLDDSLDAQNGSAHLEHH